MRSILVPLALLCIVSAKRDADQKLKACCARQKSADKECKRRFCGFSAMNQKNVLHFLNLCSPRGDTVKGMWDCASSRHDHRQCCQRK
ncbi:DB module [Trichostrongylus colubriformis]|uniref:DB module n=1 Tax=Trichostrongylus colubriformis TaxID=6319 RepID=A0AAN8F9F6_TRICO